MQFLSRNISTDLLRILAILAVILIHTSIKVIQAGGGDIQKYWGSYLAHQLSGFAVPVFFMVSGFVLTASYKGNIVNFYLKRLSKIIIPLFFWSLFYFYLVYPGAKDFLYAFITGSASYQLYFIPTLAIYYLFFPLLHTTYKFWSAKVILFSIFLFQIYLLYQDFYIANFELAYFYRIAWLGFFNFLFGIWAYFNQSGILKAVSKFKLLILLSILVLGIFISFEGQVGTRYYSQWRPSVLVYSQLIFIFLLSSLPSIINYQFLISNLSKLSFFVFFVHVWILELIWHYLSPPASILFLLVAIISFSLAHFAHKVPLLSKITG